VIINPSGMAFPEWADHVTNAVSQFGAAPSARMASGWQDWASQLIEVPGIAAQLPPRPENYPDWRIWAEDFNQAVEF